MWHRLRSIGLPVAALILVTLLAAPAWSAPSGADQKEDATAAMEPERPRDKKKEKKDDKDGHVELTARAYELEVDGLKGAGVVGLISVDEVIHLHGKKVYIEKELPYQIVVLTWDDKKRDDKKDDRHDRKDGKKNDDKDGKKKDDKDDDKNDDKKCAEKV